MNQATSITAAFLAKLGFTPYQEGLVATRIYDPTEYGIYPQRSDWQKLQEELNKEYRRNHKEYMRADFVYTVVKAGIILRGLPAAPEFFWPDGNKREPDATTGSASMANLVIKDDGTISEFRLNSLPVEVSATPLSLSTATWQEALKELIATYFVSHANPKDITYTDSTRDREFTEYASVSVLTQIKPIYWSRSKSTYVPAWCFVVEERLVKDGTPVNTEIYILDAVTLDNPRLLALK